MTRDGKRRSRAAMLRCKKAASSPFKQIPRGRYDPVMGWIPHNLPSEIGRMENVRIIDKDWYRKNVVMATYNPDTGEFRRYYPPQE